MSRQQVAQLGFSCGKTNIINTTFMDLRGQQPLKYDHLNSM